MSVAGRPPTAIELAQGAVELAGAEADEGYRRRNPLKVRQAAEKAWLAASLATDHAMEKHGRTPEAGPSAHSARHEFLEAIGEYGLSEKLGYFADRLHGDCFYRGACPTEDGMRRALGEVREYVRRMRDEV
ncbi:MAG TPA: hypothetical protein VGB42_08785 [Candidatus Thermoplasmatota archaeon]